MSLSAYCGRGMEPDQHPEGAVITRDKICAEVQTLLRANGVATPPVPVEKIAKALGVRVHRVPSRQTFRE